MIKTFNMNVIEKKIFSIIYKLSNYLLDKYVIIYIKISNKKSTYYQKYIYYYIFYFLHAIISKCLSVFWVFKLNIIFLFIIKILTN